jgi:hypothetical protein
MDATNRINSSNSRVWNDLIAVQTPAAMLIFIGLFLNP